MYYITLYNLKSTQDEDSDRVKRIVQSIIKRLVRIQDEISCGLRDKSDEDDSFVEGLCRVLGGLNAATSRYVVSSTMAHLLMSQDGTRFKFSHDVSDLLVGQIEACLEGDVVDFRIRINSYKRKRVVWRDCMADDYIHRPTDAIFEDMCSYAMAMRYKKKYLSFKQMNKMEENVWSQTDDYDTDDDDDYYDYSTDFQSQFTSVKYAFKESHPGFKFSHLAELKHEVIPRISLPKDRLCDVEILQIDSDVVE